MQVSFRSRLQLPGDASLEEEVHFMIENLALLAGLTHERSFMMCVQATVATKRVSTGDALPLLAKDQLLMGSTMQEHQSMFH